MISTFEEERREVLAGIMESQILGPDADREAACLRLLEHLAGRPPVRGHSPAGYRLTLTASSKMFCGN
jgi:hypothetical protein